MTRLRTDRLDPSVCGGSQVSRDIARGNTGEPQNSDCEMREVLTYAAADCENFVGRRMNSRSSRLVLELLANRFVDSGRIRSHVFRRIGPREPEEFLHRRTEWDVAGRGQK